jgi:4-coumarate--CoA ligase
MRYRYLNMPLRNCAVPEDITTWQWIFESPEYSPVLRSSKADLGGYINAVTKERLDFAEVKEHATHLSTALVRDYGLKPEDTVSLFSTNTVWYPVAMWAILRAGGRVNGASPAYTADEMAHALKTASTKFLFTLPASLDVALTAARQAGMPEKHIFLLQGKKDGLASLQELIERGKGYRPKPFYRIPASKTNKEVCGYLNFSSGTPLQRTLLDIASEEITDA